MDTGMTRLKLSVIFNSGVRIGPGKVELLRRVQDTGSISAAARSMKMSYKRAWLLIESMNSLFREPVVSAATGGRKGGGASLTPFGFRVLVCLERLETEARKSGERDLRTLERMTRSSRGS
jgi:molybdate transport system regulatory protein